MLESNFFYLKEMRTFLLLLVTFLSVITSCLAYGSGAPPSACSSLLPVHRGGNLQQTSPPYTVTAEKTGPNKVKITISSPIGEDIMGFILQARSYTDKNKFIPGEFRANEVTKAVDCFNKKKSTLTHMDTSSKSQVTTEWTATSPVNEDVIFRATVAKSYAVFWKDIDSKPIKIRSTGGGQAQSAQRNSQALSIYDDCFKSKGCFGMPEKCVDRSDCEVLFTYQKNPNGGIRFALHGVLEQSEYMAMALSDDDKMGEDYVTECFRDGSNNGRLRNSWNDGKSNSRTTEPDDDFDFSFRNGLTTCVWTKPDVINTNGRTYDLADKKYHILLAKGPVQNGRLRYHPSRLPSGDAVDFTVVGAVASAGATDSVKIHGTFMVTAWIGFVSIAILLARHFKNTWENSTLGGVKIWFALHRAFMLTALVFIIIAFIVIFVHKNGWNYQTSNPHAILGCIATCLGILNPIMALFRPGPDHPKRPIFNWLHFIVGNGAQLIAVITIFFAVTLPSAGLTTSFYWVMAIFVIVHLIFHFMYQAHSWTEGKKKINELSMNEMNGSRAHSAQNGNHNNQAKKITADVFRILLLGIYCIFILIILIALYALIGVA